MGRPDVLVVFTPLLAQTDDDGRVVVTNKFVQGMERLAQLWGGPVRALLEPTETPTSNLDHVTVSSTSVVDYVVADFKSPNIAQHLRDAAVAMLVVDHRENHLGTLCRGLGVPFVVCTENTLKNRLRLAWLEEESPLVRARRSAWEVRQEHKNRRLIRQAAGVQCNGTPTFEVYRSINNNPLLYFDTRAGHNEIISEGDLERRLASQSEHPLRLVFSGRLVEIKGADHLVPVAKHLAERKINFTLDIFGGGPLEDQIRADVEQAGLEKQVRLHGVVDFDRELMPWTQKNADAFLCCHRQGDPACTYHETLACGVPIVGYTNEALRGLLLQAPVGEVSALDDPEALAERVIALDKDRASLKRYARRGRTWAAENAFETGFEKRIQHLKDVVR